ncbi:MULTISPECIES: acyltransferase family protein [Streptomyces]|uniref:acyltransferase family protein n=1 Tax=Streptomyces TaxID=1883 RepID=UPI001996D4D3|nr:acyltransferase [Streptomyces sp. WAC06128]GGZ07937.1 acyltransferase [Streptomyces geysiriensis]
MAHDEMTGGAFPPTAVGDPGPARPGASAGVPDGGPQKAAGRARSARLDSLTGLRFGAALLVFFNHVGLPFPHLRLLESDSAAMNLFDVTGNAGALGVTFFFVLSGFVLTWSARDRDTAPRFWRRRLVKIYPNYVITWALALVLFASVYTTTGTAIANLFMVHVWVPDFEVFSSVNQPSWSLGCEAFFYACFPLLHSWFQRIRAEHLKYWIVGVTAGIIATPWAAYVFIADKPYFPGASLGATVSAEQYWFAYNLPVTRVLDFALGMLVAQAVVRGRWFNIGMVWSGVLLAGSYVLCSHVPFLYSQRSVTIIPIVLLIAAAATADIRGTASWFRGRTMLWLGEISFAFYLVHFIVLTYMRKELEGTFSVAETTCLVALGLVISVLASWALYALVERPITRRFSSSRRARRAAAS